MYVSRLGPRWPAPQPSLGLCLLTCNPTSLVDEDEPYLDEDSDEDM